MLRITPLSLVVLLLSYFIYGSSAVSDDSMLPLQKRLSRILNHTQQIEVPGDEYREKLSSGVFYDVSQADRACDEAAKRFYLQREKFEQQESEPDWLNIYTKEYEYKSAVEHWERSCFLPLNDSMVRTIRTSVGYLELDGVPFCTAFYGPDGNLRTARHCFFNKKNNSPAVTFDRKTDVGFHSIAEPNMKVQIKSMIESYGDTDADNIPHTSDIVVLITEQLADNIEYLQVRAPTEKERLTIIGLNGYKGIDRGKGILLESKLSSCFIQRISKNGCIYHGCNTAPGFSGSPMIVTEGSGNVVVVGMHISAARSESGCEEKEIRSPIRGLGNIGIILNAAIE